ncbi:MAG: chemotaxis protein CheA [Opitutaceae bacterium]|nr:chemotaxis protein CheA [Opitutaceae bacterium]
MSLSSSTFATVDEAVNRLAGEFVLVRPGRDDGLIPSYSLLSEIADALGAVPSVAQQVLRTRATLDHLLDGAQPFDEVSLASLGNLIEWLPGAMAAVRAGTEAPVLEGDPARGTKEKSERLSFGGESRAEPVTLDRLLVVDLTENRDLLEEFHAEALDHLHQIESSLLMLDEEPRNREALDRMFRSFHTIKGVSGFLHLAPLQGLSHEVESLLDSARAGSLTLTPEIITTILHCRDAMQRLVRQVGIALEKGDPPEEIVPVEHLIASVRRLAERRQEGAVSIHKDPAARPGNSDKVTGADGDQGAPRTIRISTEKLDTMMEAVGELVIAQTQVVEASRALIGESPDLQQTIARLGRITRGLQNHAMALRMVPIRPLFQKMGRLVRDLTRQGNRKCSFQAIGADIEIDRSVVEDMADPLVHMIRNAMDHGIESPEERVASGKPESGMIVLRASQEGSHVRIDLSDDGRGIDPEVVFAKAVEKGIIPSNAVLSREEKLNLIFASGFSTAEAVTSLSGRGVGMDVVRRNIINLRGSVRIETAPGMGTTFRITLPLTLAIIDGVVVRVGADRFILPSANVQMAVRPDAGVISTVQGRGEVLDNRGRILPVHRLHRTFQIPGAIEDPTKGILLLVKTSDRVMALLVDEMVSKQEVVIKDLGGYMSRLPGITGGAILGDGRVALILNPDALVAA